MCRLFCLTLSLFFINDAFLVTGNMGDIVNKQDIQYLYKIYCEENGDSTDIISDAITLNRKIVKSASVNVILFSPHKIL